MNYLQRLVVSAAFTLTVPTAIAKEITTAAFALPVQRYGHFALGPPHEYARLAVTTDTGQSLTFDLPDNEVFEDLTPRIVTLAATEAEEIVAIVSNRDSGSRLVLLALRDGRLEISAQSPPVGTPMRWLNPVGVADLDGDGRAEIAAVLTPHIGGTLKVYRRQGAALVEAASLGGFSNHVNHTPELALSLPVILAGKTRLLVPDSTRRQLRIVGLENGRLVETGRCPLLSPVTGGMQQVAPAEVALTLVSGRTLVHLDTCAR